MRLCPAPADRIPGIWAEIRDHIAGACEFSGGKYAAGDILKALLARNMQLWLVVDGDRVAAIVLTEIASYPRFKVCKLLACTGEARETWTHLIGEIEAWARAQGCAVLESIARPGWERVLKPLGYTRTHVVLEKRLT